LPAADLELTADAVSRFSTKEISMLPPYSESEVQKPPSNE